MTDKEGGNAESASAGHDHLADAALIARANKMRALDRRMFGAAKKIVKALLICAVPVGVVAALVLPNALPNRCRAQQSEAKATLKTLYVVEESYRGEFDSYTNDVTRAGFSALSPMLRYRYFVRTEDKHFQVVAVGEAGSVIGDRWVLTENNDLRNTANACER